MACLGRQFQARLTNGLTKASVLSKLSSAHTGERACNAQKSTLPSLGTKCGRRERETGSGRREERSSRPLEIATVKGILIVWKPSSFAGWRWNGGLGRSVTRGRVSPLSSKRAGDSGCLLGAEEGNVVSVRSQSHASIERHGKPRTLVPETRPSLGPRTRARRSSLNHAGESRRGWREERGIAVGQTRVTGRNRHRDFVRRTKRGSPRATAPQGAPLARQKRKEVAASVPARKRES